MRTYEYITFVSFLFCLLILNGQDEFERARLPSAGLGLRYMVSKVKRINLRLNYGYGIDGNQGLYFGVMEVF